MQKSEHTPSPETPYYTLDTSLFTGMFHYFDRGKPVEVRGKAHRSDERYRFDRGAERDIRPIPTLQGERTYMHIKPYVLVPDIVLTVGLYQQPKHYADQDPAIGKVLKSQEAAQKKEIEIGNAQAWYYPQDRIIELWECCYYDFVRDTPLLTDKNMKQLWTGTEQFLTVQFPDAKQIVTPFHDPLYEREEYQTFLRTHGFEPAAKAAYGKLL